jgi:translation initiation factor IF-1
MNNKNDLYLEYEGKVIQKLPEGYFKIEVMKGAVKLITASIANSLKRTNRRWKKIAEGDKVKVKIPLGDLTKGRIIELLD